MDLQALRHLLGPFPDRCTLHAVVIETVDCGSYVRQTVEYAVEANERIRSFLLLPKPMDRPAHAVFAHHQHNCEFYLGKSEVVGLAGDPTRPIPLNLPNADTSSSLPMLWSTLRRTWGTRPVPTGFS